MWNLSLRNFKKKKKKKRQTNKKSTNPFLRSFAGWAWWGKWQERKVRGEKLSLVGQAQQDGWKFFQALGIRCENSKITSQFPGDVHALFETFTKSQWRRNERSRSSNFEQQFKTFQKMIPLSSYSNFEIWGNEKFTQFRDLYYDK